jgi:hypothetical protein
MSGIRSSVDVADSIVVFAGKLFKGLASSLGNEEGGEAAEQHEESVDLQDVVQPVLTIVSLEGGSCQRRQRYRARWNGIGWGRLHQGQ